jgi:Conjugal transfer protein
MRKHTALGLIFAALTAQAQSTNYGQIQHVHTSLNHLTELDLGEQIQSFALADPDAFSVQQEGTRVFIKPSHDQRSTNLFVFTATRQVILELDPAGDVSHMDVVVSLPFPNGRKTTNTTTSNSKQEPSDEEIQKIAQLVLTRTMLGTEPIAHDETKLANNRVAVQLEQVYRTNDATYIRYSIWNRTNHPFRLTTPDVATLTSTQIPVSLVSLRNHQLKGSMVDDFKAKRGTVLSIISAEISGEDLAPGQTLTGVVSVKGQSANPAQLLQLNFGNDRSKPVTAEAVL